MAKVRQCYESGGLPKKIGVTVCRKQPDSNIWAISPALFIDETTGISLAYYYKKYTDLAYCVQKLYSYFS